MIKIGHFGGFEKFACLMFVSCLRSTFDVRREPHARREPTWTGAKFWRELSCFIVGAYGSRRGTGHKPRSRFTVSSLRLDLETTCIDVGKWSVKLGLSKKNKQRHTSNSSILLTSLPSTKNDDRDSHNCFMKQKNGQQKNGNRTRRDSNSRLKSKSLSRRSP